MMHVVHAIASFRQTDGGPPRSVGQLCDALACNDALEMRLLFGENDIQERAPISSAVQCTAVPYIYFYNERPFTHAGFAAQLDIIHRQSPIQILHQHGIWQKQNWETASFARKHQIPLIIAPRGMLEPWALNRGRWKKRLIWFLHQRQDLRRAQAFHATAAEEAENMRRLGLTQPIAVIPNGIQLPPVIKREPKARQATKTALFLSRINPKKGIPMLLDAWKQVAPADWRLHIAGNDEDQHLKVVERKIAELSLQNQVHILGPLYDAEKEKAFAEADLFILPSYSENFGIVVAEALGYSLPVLTTTGCPWRELVSADCGWWVDPNPDAMRAGLSEALGASAEELIAKGKRGRQLVEARYQWPAIASSMQRFYEWMLMGGAAPDFVTNGA